MTRSIPATFDTLARQTYDLLVELVRNACVNDLTRDSGQEIRSVETLEQFFSGTSVTMRRLEAHKGRTSLVVTVPGRNPQAPPLTFIGHLDVVPADVAAWSHDPFAGDSDGEILWGRGVVDMLYLSASMAVVTREVARRGGLEGTLTFVAAADEEARGGLGVPWIGLRHPDAVPWENCLSEMGGAHIHGRDGTDSIVVVVGEKGAAQRRIHVTGDAGHGSVPHGKRSALENIVEVSRRLHRAGQRIVPSALWERFVRAFAFETKTEQALISGTYDGDFTEFGDLSAYAHAISHVTFVQTVMRAGGPINVIPSTAYVELDIRTLPGVSDDDVDDMIRDALGELAGQVRIERLLSEEASASPENTHLYESIVQVLRRQHPNCSVIPVLFPGGSDLRVARKLKGYGYGFGSHASQRTLGSLYGQLHAHDEHLYLEDLDLTVHALMVLTEEFWS